MGIPAEYDVIPTELRGRLEGLRPLLTAQGCVQRRCPGGSWRIRYRVEIDGERRHMSLPLGDDDEVAIACAELIQSWRQDQIEPAFTTSSAPDEETAKQKLNEALIKAVVALKGGKRRRQERALKAYRELMAYPTIENICRMLYSDEHFVAKKAGRPRKSRLW